MIYFAYGSNLCFSRFLSRVPSAIFICVAKLPCKKVVFHKRSVDGSGKATLVPLNNAVTHGALFSFDDNHLPDLQKAEGYPQHYREETVIVSTLDGDKQALTYVGNPSYLDKTQVPYQWYLDLIRIGGRRLGLPEDYIAQFDNIAYKNDTDSKRTARERAFLR